MNFMKIFSKQALFAVEDICAIIRTCKEQGVRSFEYNGLKILLSDQIQNPVTESVFVSREVKQLQDSQTREAYSDQEQKLKQEKLEQLLIEDPVAYEELIRSGDLVDERT